MKKYIMSALLGAILMLLALVLIANTHNRKSMEEYEHIDYVSTITPEVCFVCSEQGPYWGEDNVGLLDLNTFEFLYLPLNRYGDRGELIEEPAGVMMTGGLMKQETETYVHAYMFPDNAYARIDLTGVQYAIDRDSIQTRLCQNCLDSINNLWFTTQPPAEFAVVSFEEKTIQPILNAYPWFGAGNYGIDCEFKVEGTIDLLIHYCPNRYEIEEHVRK